jgi:hypothetical protein
MPAPRKPLVSRSPRRSPPAAAAAPMSRRVPRAGPDRRRGRPRPQFPPLRPRRRAARPGAPGWRAIRARCGRLGSLATLAGVAVLLALQPGARVITQEHIDEAVRASLENEPLPSAAAKAYEAILPSVVRVTGLMDEKDDGEDKPEQRAWTAAWAPASSSSTTAPS